MKGLRLRLRLRLRIGLRMRKEILFGAFCFLSCPAGLLSQAYEFQGQLSGWITVTEEESSPTQVGLRYIPSLFISKSVAGAYSIDAELSLNTYGTGLVHAFDDVDTDGKMKPYRLWLRFSGSQCEVRLGLQKINFGSASLLRPLMWFDRIDSRDPLQLTDGVYGLLFRYYFLNNANIWLWGLYGNGDTKGWDIVPSVDNVIEYGGRFQYPVPTGEIAFSYHRRKMDLEKGLHSLLSMIYGDIPREFYPRYVLAKKSASENRFGLDAKWDMEIGVWFEGVLLHQDIDILAMKYQRLVNIGCDYTFGLGNGLHILGSGEGFEFSALSVNYPLGLVDNITGILYYDWENGDWYRFINWQRTYDKWRFHLIGFWNPERFQIYRAQDEVSTLRGKGVQLLIIFNH
jgi:hypothetical protein